MFRYLRAAFLVTEKVPFLGRLPVNLMAIAAFVALGFGHPAFWLIGIIGEIAFLWALTGSRRFRNWVDARERFEKKQNTAEIEATALSTLSTERQQRYQSLRELLARIQTNREKNGGSESSFPDDLDSYRDLLRIFLQRLQTQERLTSPHRKEDLQSIHERANALTIELEQDKSLTDSARDSRLHTLDILKKRIAVYEKRKETLDEIDSDLEQIEEQFHLALESSEIGSSFDSTRFDLHLARSMITTPSYVAFADDSVDAPFPEEMESE